jgi:hypothetical protein
MFNSELRSNFQTGLEEAQNIFKLKEKENIITKLKFVVIFVGVPFLLIYITVK